MNFPRIHKSIRRCQIGVLSHRNEFVYICLNRVMSACIHVSRLLKGNIKTHVSVWSAVKILKAVRSSLASKLHSTSIASRRLRSDNPLHRASHTYSANFSGRYHSVASETTIGIGLAIEDAPPISGRVRRERLTYDSCIYE